MTVTDVPCAIVSVDPVMAHPALGLQPTVTDTFAPEVSRGVVMELAPTRSTGAAHAPVTKVLRAVGLGRGRGAGVCPTSRRPGVGVDAR